MRKLARACLVPLFLCLVLLGSFKILGDAYGLGWDEAAGDLYFGHAFLEYYGGAAPEAFEHIDHPSIVRALERPFPWRYFPLGPLLSALSCELFFYRTGFLPALPAHHVLPALLCLLALWFFCCEVFRGRSRWLRIACVVFSITMPTLHGLMRIDARDTTVMATYTLGFSLFARAYRTKNRLVLLLSFLAIGACVAAKINGIVLIASIGLFIALQAFMDKPACIAWIREHWRIALLLPAVVLGVLFAVWPWLWLHPVDHLLFAFVHFTRRGVAEEGEWFSGLRNLLVVLSPLDLCLIAVGGFVLLRNEITSLFPLFFAWMLPIFLRSNLPLFRDYDGIRHTLEVLPPIFALEVLGVAAIARFRWAQLPTTFAAYHIGRLPSLALSLFLVALCLVSRGQRIAAYFPYEYAYSNALFGVEPSDYWGTSYREALYWLNNNAVQNAEVVVPVAEHIAFAQGSVLRSDIDLVHAGIPVEGGMVAPSFAALQSELLANERTYVVSIIRPEFYPAWYARWRISHQPIHRIGPAPSPTLGAVPCFLEIRRGGS